MGPTRDDRSREARVSSEYDGGDEATCVPKSLEVHGSKSGQDGCGRALGGVASGGGVRGKEFGRHDSALQTRRAVWRLVRSPLLTEKQELPQEDSGVAGDQRWR